MPNILCPDNFAGCDCVDDNPFANLSAEAPDLPVFLSTQFFSAIPPLGDSYGPLSCMAFCQSAVSQQAADLCAELAAFECVGGGFGFDGGGPPNPPVPPPQGPLGRVGVPIFTNNPQSATVLCPDGLPFTFTVPGGLFAGFSQLQADTAAETYALQQAQMHVLCLGPLQPFVCQGAAYSSSITATGNFLAVAPQADIWQISGSLPPGLTIPEFIFTTGAVTGGVIHIVGTPTTPGVYNFTITITDPSGDFISKDYTITVAGITNANSLPDAVVGTPYSQNLTSIGYVNPIYSLESGALPDGLSLDPGGIIFGTPTTMEDSTFTLGVTEAGVGNTCTNNGSINVTNPAFSCGAVPQNVQDTGNWTFFGTAPAPCQQGTLSGGTCTAWNITFNTTTCNSNGSPTMGWSTTLCNPGPAYLLTVTLPWGDSGNVSGSPPFNFTLNLIINGILVGSATGNMLTATPSPLVVTGMLPAMQVSSVVIQLDDHDVQPGPSYTINSTGNLTVRPLTHP